MAKTVNVYYEATPNPQSMKFVVDRSICDESVQFDDPLKANRSPLAHKIFGFPWASAVFVGPNFVTITKEDWVDWQTLAAPLAQLIEEHLETGQAVILPSTEEEPESFDTDPNDPPVVQQIKQIIHTEIRPAVAMDGGDIVFHKYEDNIVYIYMQGACAGCPSASMTLKMGIEARIKEGIPDVKEVVAMQ